MTALTWLGNGYSAQCNGAWEHAHGIGVTTLDKLGWPICSQLHETPYVNLPFREEECEGDQGWIPCKVSEGVFEGYGGAENLEELVTTFKMWIEHRPTGCLGAS